MTRAAIAVRLDAKNLARRQIGTGLRRNSPPGENFRGENG